MEARVVAGEIAGVVAKLGEAALDVLDERHRGIPVGAVGGGVRGAPSGAIETGGVKGGVVGPWSSLGLLGVRGLRTVALGGARGHPPIDVNGMDRSGQRERGPNGHWCADAPAPAQLRPDR